MTIIHNFSHNQYKIVDLKIKKILLLQKFLNLHANNTLVSLVSNDFY